jgi:myo-inositol-hexaphosphate 3-phosphohydrolase
VRVHALPTLSEVRALPLPGEGVFTGICVARERGRSLLFVTEETAGSVVAIDSASGRVWKSWSHGLTSAESVACDDEWRRLIVCDDTSRDGCQAFSYYGQRVGREFGRGEFDTDAEGVAIYRCPQREGYIVVSDQHNDEFEVFDRGSFEHLCTFSTSHAGALTHDTDGIDILQSGAYPEGLLGACDDCSSESADALHLTPWSAIAEACGLRVCPLR